ncbi:crocetin glucosyltransferase, chloroplastic-like [Syzygium oleosum]|uniref:crocetin glucosyltransferase, chloroplastic-like n=1 Tax=Syzygium oleosum TaxID=219896 RepID=UPI0011D22A19|nr:crocetin glucosyltransferase, chloroplastic-like [Syzygium oleosum]
MGSHAPSPPPAAAAVAPPHFLLVTFPAQGHINPALQFAKRLLRGGAEVTFATSVSACSRMSKGQTHLEGLHFAAFSDGYDDGFKQGDDMTHFVSEVKRRGSEKLKDLIASSVGEGRPYTCLVYSLLIPWAAEVARDFHVPSALLWIQPATVLDMYYYYFHGYGEFIKNKCLDPSCSFELPGLPYKLTSRDLPSFLAPNSSGVYAFALPAFKNQLDTINQENNPRILVNTFDSLEPEALRAIDRYNMVGIGPLIPSAFIDGIDPSDTSFGGDLFHKSKDYTEWLDSKAPASVIYVSFGSTAVISKRQAEELACALLDCGRPFLWVIRADQNGKEEKDEDRLSCLQELEEKGMIVPWCSQLEVLSHPSLGCFVTHCGWNSTLESLALGVPVVAFPQWTDQGTNAKLVEDVWRTGVRVRPNEEGLVEAEEVRRCLETVMADGERREEVRRNAVKWKELAREAAAEGGSSDRNLKNFIKEVGQGCQC